MYIRKPTSCLLCLLGGESINIWTTKQTLTAKLTVEAELVEAELVEAEFR